MDKKPSGNDRQTVEQDRNVMHDQVFQLEHSAFFFYFPFESLGKVGSAAQEEMPEFLTS